MLRGFEFFESWVCAGRWRKAMELVQGGCEYGMR